MRVFLTGFMGAGKSTVGRTLAQVLEVPFVDLDDEVEAAAGCSIPRIFAERGEEEFRRLEHRCLCRACEAADVVLATGGGAAAYSPSEECMRQNGVRVWLDVPFEVIVRRLGEAPQEQRPLFGNREAVRDLLRRRIPFYRRAEHRVEVGAQDSPEVIARRIARLLGHGGETCAT